MAHIFNDLIIEVSNSPEIMLFVRLRRNWDKLIYNKSDAKYLDLVDFGEESQNLVKTLCEEALHKANSELMLKRDDYIYKD